jgi:hypothetical protein
LQGEKLFENKIIGFFFCIILLKLCVSNASLVQEIITEVYVHFCCIFKKKNIDAKLHMQMKDRHHHTNNFSHLNLFYIDFRSKHVKICQKQ